MPGAPPRAVRLGRRPSGPRRPDAKAETVRERHPALEGLGVKAFVHEGEARVRHRAATTTDEFRGLFALYSALAREA